MKKCLFTFVTPDFVLSDSVLRQHLSRMSCCLAEVYLASRDLFPADLVVAGMHACYSQKCGDSSFG